MWRYVIGLNLIVLVWAGVFVFSLPLSIAILVTLMVVLTLGAMIVFERFKAGKSAFELEKALGAQADSMSSSMRPDQVAEIEEMQAQFLKEVGSLKASKLGGGGMTALYSLPWYMIIGPPGAGKSTALRNSGLNFPSSRGRVRGIGGTRNCDWWLSNDAILLDTAGRYATQDEDRDEWWAFLDIIKKHRKERPINGLIAAVSITDLAGKSEDQVNALARQIRERLDETMERLEVDVPIYLMFTKADLIPSFIETFGHFKKEDRGQPWGITFRLDQPTEQVGAIFAERLEELSAVLEDRMYMALQNERRVEMREKIYQFPQHFRLLNANLRSFVENLAAANPLKNTPRVRGVYLTSGTQEGNPLDLLTSSMMDGFGASQAIARPAVTTEPKSYFLRDVFGKIMFPDKDVASRSSKGKRAILFKRIGIGAATLVTVGLLTILPLHAYQQNIAVVDSTGTMIKEIVAERMQNQDKVIPPVAMQSLRGRLADIKAWSTEAPPLAMRYGMYQGDTLFPFVRRFYVQTLQRELLEPILQHDVAEMQTLRQVYGFNSRPSEQEYQRFFDKLKLHLLLTAPHGKGEPVLDGKHKEWVISHLSARWANALEKAPTLEERGELRKDVEFYLSLLQDNPQMAIGRDQSAVRDTRNMLNRVSYAEAVVKKIIAETSTQDHDLNLRRIMGGAVTPVKSDRSLSVRAAFTRWAWDNIVRERLEEAAKESDRWVFGQAVQGASRGELLVALRAEYFKNYIQEWRAFVDSLRVKQPNDIRDALSMLRDLTRGEPTPFKRLMQAVAHNTTLPEKELPAGSDAVAAVGGNFLQRAVKKIVGRQAAGALRAVGEGAINNAGQDLMTAAHVSEAFRGFYSFGYTPPPPKDSGAIVASVPLDFVQEQLIFLRDAVQAYADNPAEGEGLMTCLQETRTSVKAVLGQMEVGSGWRPRIESLVWPLIESVAESLVSLKAGVNRNWCNSVVATYLRSFKNRYPFAQNMTAAPLEDVSGFFKPGTGVLWAFYSESLSRDLHQSGSNFVFDNRMGGVVKRSYLRTLPSYLRRAYTLSNSLFPSGAEVPRVDFDVRIIASPAFGVISLEVGGNKIDYRGGPEL